MRRKKERRGAEKRAGLGGGGGEANPRPPPTEGVYSRTMGRGKSREGGGEANLAGLDVPQPEVARAGHERAGAGQDAQRAQGMQVAAVHLRRET